MDNVLFFVVALVVAGIVIVALWWRERRPPSVEEGIEAFHRELEALAPDSPPPDRRRAPPEGPTPG